MADHKKPPPQEEHGESAPLWIISFADLVTLLMSFFVILSVKPQNAATDPHFAKLVAAVRAAFRAPPEAVSVDSAAIDIDALIRGLQAMGKDKDRGTGEHKGDSHEEGIYGNSFRVRRLRDGMELTAGGPVFFDPFSDKLNKEGQKSIADFGDLLKGHRNMVEIRGHAAEEPRPADWTFEDALKLSYARALHVAQELILRGVDPRALRITAVGPNEPIAKDTISPAERANNRRVEIIVRESLIDDFIGQIPAYGGPATRPAMPVGHAQ